MTKQTKTSSRAASLDELARNFVDQTIRYTKRRIALERKFPGAFVTYRRAARSGPNSDSYIILVKEPGKAIDRYVCDEARLNQLAEGATDEEALAWMDKKAAAGMESEAE